MMVYRVGDVLIKIHRFIRKTHFLTTYEDGYKDG
jgi:hypothetical protein